MFNRTAWTTQYALRRKAEHSAFLAYDKYDDLDDYENLTPEGRSLLAATLQEYRKAGAALQEFLRESLIIEGIDHDIREALELRAGADDPGPTVDQVEATQEEIDAYLAHWCQCSENYLAFQDRIAQIMATTSRERLDEFKTLRLGWLQSPDLGKPCSPEKLDWVATWLEQEEVKGLPQPYIFPTESGGVQLSWDYGSEVVDLEIDLETKVGIWHLTNEDLEAEPATFDLSTPEGTAAWRAQADLLGLVGRKFK